MRRKAVLLLALALTGCFPDQAKDVANCEAQSARFFPPFKVADPNAPASRFIIECMASKGYEFTVTPAGCDSHHALPTQATCYAPENWLASVYDQLRRRVKAN